MTSVILSRGPSGGWRVTLSGQAKPLYETHPNAYGAARTVAKREAKARGLPLVDQSMRQPRTTRSALSRRRVTARRRAHVRIGGRVR